MKRRKVGKEDVEDTIEGMRECKGERKGRMEEERKNEDGENEELGGE